MVPDFVFRQAENLIRIINESGQIAANSKVIRTRRSRLAVAYERLAELKALTEKYPKITITALDQFEHDLSKVSAEIDEQDLKPPPPTV